MIPSGEYFTATAIGAAFAAEPANVPPSVACLDSATSALALAVRMASELRAVSAPEVIVPAYSCPDIPAAVIASGALPVPVDVEPGSPYPSAPGVSAACTAQTVAVISASLFGRDAPDIHAVSDVCRNNAVLHIIDRAQSPPSLTACRPDVVEVYSCGRGKPVSLGYGGLLVVGEQLTGALTRQRAQNGVPGETLSARAKLLLRSMLLRAAATGPGMFLARRIPFAGVGMTRYRQAAPPRFVSSTLIKAVEDSLLKRPPWPNIAARVYDKHTWRGATPLFDARTSPPLWRFPVLLRDAGAQARIIAAPGAGDLGLSALYRREVSTYLPQDALPPRLRSEQWPHARDLGAKLLTLPVHSRVGERTALAVLRMVDP